MMYINIDMIYYFNYFYVEGVVSGDIVEIYVVVLCYIDVCIDGLLNIFC